MFFAAVAHSEANAFESKDRGWIDQLCCVPCLSGNTRVRFCGLQQRAVYGHTCLCLFVTVTKQGTSSSTAQVLHSSGSPQALPYVAVVLSIALHFTLSVPVNSIFRTYSLSFHCQASKRKIFYVLSHLLSTSTLLNPSNLFWSYFCHEFCHILCQLRPITKLFR